MQQHVIETVTFKLNAETKHSDFVAAAIKTVRWVEQQPGFIQRRLSVCDDGTWIDYIEWNNMDAARAAAAGISKEPDNADFLEAIDGSSVKLRHSIVEVSLK